MSAVDPPPARPERDARWIAEQRDRLATLASGLCLDAQLRIRIAEGQGWSWHPIDRVITLEAADIRRLGVEACAGVVAHEVGHHLITRAQLFPLPFPDFRAAMMLLNGLEDPRVETWIKRRYPGTAPWIDEANASLLDRPSDYGTFMEFVLQCASEEQRGWRAAPPRLAERFPEGVSEALEQTRGARRRYAETLPSAELDVPASRQAQLRRRYLAEVAPRLALRAARVVPHPGEQQVRLSALQALDLAAREVFPVARQLYRRDVDQLASSLASSKARREAGEKALADRDLEQLIGVRRAAAEDAAAGRGAPPRAEHTELAERIQAQLMESLERQLQELAEGLGRPGPGGVRVLIEGPPPRGLRPRGRARLKPWDRRLPPIRLRWQEDDYDLIYARIASQLHPLSEAVRRLLRPRQRMGRRSGYPTGQRVDLRRLMAFEADPRGYDKLWQRSTIPIRHRTEVLLLVDLSGSMQGDKTEAALAGTILCSEMLSSLKVPFAVIGFQDELVPLLDFDQPFSQAARRRLLEIRSEVMGTRSGGNNRPDFNDDGPCLAEAAALLLARPAQDHILIAISDGLPEGRRSTAEDLRQAVASLSAEQSLSLIGVGLGPDTGHVSDYYPSAIANVPVERFAHEMGRLLEALVTR